MGFFNLPPTQIKLSMSHNLVMSFDIKQPVPVFQSIHTERKVHTITITKMKWALLQSVCALKVQTEVQWAWVICTVTSYSILPHCLKPQPAPD